MGLYVCVCVYLWVHEYLHALRIHEFVCLSVGMCVCVCVCVCVCALGVSVKFWL